MYESRFGISGPPFQLSPDPSFYFDSRAHHDALAALRGGLAEEAGFAVVTGEIGAGKTTLVRTLLGDLDPARIAVAHVVSTQLDGAELLGALLIGFGVPPASVEREALAARLSEFLVRTREAARRAVLVVDEAQNLRPDAFDVLVDVAQRAADRRVPMLVWLVGQPELRTTLESPALHALRERVRVSCHLGPMAGAEVGPYIEHRLRKVGWTGHPHFEAGAFEAVYRWTHGIPRRINLLCNRLMLACFLDSRRHVDASLVAQTARDWRVETGESDAEEPAEAETPSRAATADAPAAETGPLLCVAAGVADHVRTAVLMRAFALRRDLPAVNVVRVHDDDALELTRALFTGLDVDRRSIRLGIGPADSAGDAPAQAFGAVADRVAPRAVIVFDGTAVALACAAAAQSRGIPVIHVGAGLRVDGAQPDLVVRRGTDELADLLYTTDAPASEALAAEGMPAERVHCVGNLLVDGMQVAMRTLVGSSLNRAGESPAEAHRIGRNGYALVALGHPAHAADRATMADMLDIVRDVSLDLLLVWPRYDRFAAQCRALGLANALPDERVARLPGQPYADHVAWLRGATCVLTDSWSVQEEATALGVPCLTLGTHPPRPLTVARGSNVFVGTRRSLATRIVWECIFNGGKRGRLPPLWDGRTAARIAGFLCAWLPSNCEQGREAAVTLDTP